MLVSTSGESATTETTSDTAPGSIVASTRALRPTSSDDAGLREVLEAVERDVDLVVADGQQPQRVLPRASVAVVRENCVSRLVAVTVRARNRGPRGVLDVAEDGSGRDLRPERGGQEHDADHECRDAAETPCAC